MTPPTTLRSRSGTGWFWSSADVFVIYVFVSVFECKTSHSTPIILNLLTNRNISLIFSHNLWTKPRILHGQGASNINCSIVGLSSMFGGFHNQSPLLTMVKFVYYLTWYHFFYLCSFVSDGVTDCTYSIHLSLYHREASFLLGFCVLFWWFEVVNSSFSDRDQNLCYIRLLKFLCSESYDLEEFVRG